MPKTNTTYPAPGMLPVIIVIAISAIVAMAIAAWLVHQVALKAIDKTTPEEVAPVILALAAWLNPLRQFLPWSRPDKQDRQPSDTYDLTQAQPHNEMSPELPQEAGE